MSFRTFGSSVVAAVAVALAGTAYSQSAVQWRVADGGNGHWYQVMGNTGGCWTEHQQLSAQAGGYLATVTSAAEDAFLGSIATPEFLNIGGIQSANACEPGCGWTWITGEPWVYTRWDSGQPEDFWGQYGGQDVLARASSGWHDGSECPPYTGSGFVIEWSADCNGDGIVDYGQCRDGSLPDYDGDNIPDCCEAGTPCIVGDYPVHCRVEDGGNGHWYQTQRCTGCCYATASSIAQVLGGNLATVTEAGEQSQLLRLVPLGNAAKLGGFRAPGSDLLTGWQWMDGEPFNSSLIAWASDNPGCCGENQFWLYLQNTPGPGFGVHDGFDCSPSGADYLLIEWSADCDADGVVDFGQILRGEVADVNSNGIPDTCDCPADINQSGTIDAEDLAYVLFAWGMTGGKAGGADINGDAIVDANDLSLVLGSWGMCP